MAQSDLEGNIAYTSPLVNSVTVAPVSNAGAATAPTNPILSTSGGSSSSKQDFMDMVLNSPELKVANQNIDIWAQQQRDDQAFNSEWDKKFYDLKKAQLASSGGSYGAGLAQMEAIDKLNKEKAAHDLANQQEYTREALGSRGLGSSGQMAVDQGELKYNYDMLIKQIDLQAAARRAQAAQAGANAQRSIRQQLDSLELQRQYDLAQEGRFDSKLASDIAQKRGTALLTVMDQLKDYQFDDSSGDYVNADGSRITVDEAQLTLATGLYNTSTAKSNDLFGF